MHFSEITTKRLTGPGLLLSKMMTPPDLVNHIRSISGSHYCDIPQALHPIYFCQKLGQHSVPDTATPRRTKSMKRNKNTCSKNRNILLT